MPVRFRRPSLAPLLRLPFALPATAIVAGLAFLGGIGAMVLAPRETVDFAGADWTLSHYAGGDFEDSGPQAQIVPLPSRESGRLLFQYLFPQRQGSAWAGITLSRRGHKPLVLSQWESVEVAAVSRYSRTLNLIVHVFVPGVSVPGDDASLAPLEHEIPVWQKADSYHLALADFRIPPWWLEERRLALSELPPLEQATIENLSIEAGNLAPRGRRDTVEVRALRLNSPPLAHAWPWFTLAALAGAAAGLSLGARRLVAGSEAVSEGEAVAPKALAIVDGAPVEARKVLAWLSEHYSDPRLSLAMVAQACAMSEGRVSQVLKAATGQSFPRCLNLLRQQEACRLLRETDLPVIDVALAVGYGSVPHFNRLFKESNGCSPREYRLAARSGKENIKS